METVLLVIHLILCIGIVVLVLVQRSEGSALSGLGGGGTPGGGGMGGLMTGRSVSNLLTRSTALLAAGFMMTSLLLSLLANQERNSGSILDEQDGVPALEQPAVPAEPSAPLAR